MKILFLLCGFVLFGTWARAVQPNNLNKAGVMLDGFDPVSYFKGEKPQQGEAKWQVTADKVSYWFANESNKQEFLKDPKKYTPQFGGWCAYAVADSKSKVEVDPQSFLIQDGRLLLFYKGLWGDTRQKWTHNKENDPSAYLKEADRNWSQVIEKEP